MAKTTASPVETDGNQPLDQSELRKHLGYFLARARFFAFRTYEKHIGAVHDLRPVEFALMILLDSNRMATQKQLSHALGVAQPNMTGVLRRLEGRGLVTRTRGEKDKRMQYITLSAEGAKLLRQANAAGKGMDKAWLGVLSSGEQAVLVQLLEKVTISGHAR